MTYEELSELSDQELLEKAKKAKSNATLNAALIGFMVGIVIYGIAKSNFGLFALIPLFFAIKIFSNSKNKDLKRLLKERNLEW